MGGCLLDSLFRTEVLTLVWDRSLNDLLTKTDEVRWPRLETSAQWCAETLMGYVYGDTLHEDPFRDALHPKTPKPPMWRRFVQFPRITTEKRAASL